MTAVTVPCLGRPRDLVKELGNASSLATAVRTNHRHDCPLRIRRSSARGPGGPRVDQPPAPPKTQRPPQDAPADAPERPSKYRDPQGALLIGITGGASIGSGLRYGSAGGHIGYAVVTGVVPGVRGTAFFGDLSGGEVVGTLWLTPPLSARMVPFAVGEVGYVWQEVGSVKTSGAIYGVGGGFHFGRPTAGVAVRAGVVYRYLDFAGGGGFVSPLLAGSFRF